jgi:hypothetical protein
LIESFTNISRIVVSAFHCLKSRINLIKLLLISGFWILFTFSALAQCPIVNITFTEGQDINIQNIGICGQIGGGGQNDIDILSIIPAQSNSTYQWQYSNDPSFSTYTIDPYTGTQLVVSSFRTTPGTFYFRLRVTSTACPGGVYSDVVTLVVTGTLENMPSTTGASLCGTGSLTLAASGCTGGTLGWYASQFGGTALQTGSSYTVTLSVTTTFWVSCTISGCESPRVAAVASITSALPATPGTITGTNPVCASNSYTYSIAAVTDATSYNWTVPAGWTITAGAGTTTITATAGSAGGNISVTAVNECGTSPSASTMSVTATVSSTILTTAPGSRCGTGTVVLGATASNGGTINWYSAATGGGSLGTGTNYTTPSISSTTTYYVDATLGSCISTPRTAVTATVSTNPTPSYAGTNQIVCGNATLAGNTPVVGTGLWTIVSGTGGTITSPTSPTSTFTGTADTPYTLAWTISNFPCASSSTNVNITINTTPVVAPITPPTPVGVCIGSTVTLADVTPGGTWSSGNIGIATVVNGVVTGVSAGTVTIYYSVSSGPCTTIVNRVITVGSGITPPNISFDAASDMWSRTIGVCAQIGGGSDATDIDIRSGNVGTRQWEYKIGAGPWIIDPYTGSNWVILSFGSTPGTYSFRLRVTSGGCSVYSNTIVLIVTPGTLPGSPTANGITSCLPGSFTLTASNCSGTLNWYDAQFAGNLLTPGSGSHPSYTTPTISATTTYYVSCTVGSGNTACESPRTHVTVTIGAPANLGSIIGPASVCGGQSNVTYSVTNYTGMTYTWSYSGTGVTITLPGNTNSITISFSAAATSGNLHVSGTSSCGTSNGIDLAITVNHLAPPGLVSITQPTCTVPTGSISLNNLPAVGTWTINPGAISGTGVTTTLTGLIPGTYSLTVTDATGCISGPLSGVTLNAQPATPSAPIPGATTQPDCTTPTGSVVLSGLPAGNWVINPGAVSGSGASTTVTGLASGIYNFTVTNSTGCTSAAAANVTIIINPGPSAPTVAPGAITQPTCSVATGTVTLTGLPAGTYTIRQTSPFLVYPNLTGPNWTSPALIPGSYTYRVVSGTCLSPLSSNVVINAQPSPPPSVTATIVQPTCAVATGTITVTAPLGAYEYNIDGGLYQASVTFNAIGAGSHTIIARNPLDITCSSQAVLTINVQPVTPSAPTLGSVVQPACPTPTTGSVTLNGLPAGSWTINPGAIAGSGVSTTIIGLVPGSYNFTVTNSAGCTSSALNVVINAAAGAPAAPTIGPGAIIQPTCSVGTGTVTLTISQAGLYTIRQTSPLLVVPNLSGPSWTSPSLPPGTYTYRVGVAGCYSAFSENVVINPQPLPPTLSISSQTNVNCYGNSTGSATVTATGGTSPYTYSWAPSGGTAAIATGLAAGTYVVTVTGANGCSTTATANITQPAAPLTALITTQTNVLCAGGSTGQATVTATGGTGPYTYSWSPFGGTAASVTGIPAGLLFTVTVTDLNLCTTSATVNLSQPSAISASAAAPPILCNGGTTIITVTASGGTGALEYSLNGVNFQTANTFPGQVQGDYTITVRDANQCTTVTYLTISPAPAAISASASAPVILCSGGSTTLNVTASGGTGTLEYSLNGVTWQGGNTFAGLGTGTYTITVRDANLCTTTTSVTVTSLPALTASVSAPAILCAGGTTTITITASGGTGPLEYSLDGGAYQPGYTFTTRPAGTYSITVRDANFCTTITTLTINPGAPLPTTTAIYHQ